MGKSRRTFLKKAAIAALVPTLPVMTSNKEQIIHHVFFWLKNQKSDDEKQELIAGLKLLRSIPQVKKLIIGMPASTEKREVVDNSFHVSELMYFDTVQAQNEYQEHPLHKQFVEKFNHLWERVLVYDMITLD